MFESFAINNGIPRSKRSKEEIETVPRKEFPPEIIEARKIRERTNELEGRLEENTATEKTRKQNLAQRIVEGLKAQGQRMAQITVLLTALGLAGCYQKEKTLETPETSAQKVEGLSVAEKTEEIIRPITQEERKRIIQDTGIDVVAIAEAAHFDAQLQVPSQNGKYILHIGQSHYVSGYENKINEAKKIAQVQRGVEKILYTIAEKGITNIFNEGYTQEIQQEYPDGGKNYKRMRKFIGSLTANRECFDILANECRKEALFYTNDRTFTSDSIAVFIKELFKKKAVELKRDLETRDQFDDKMKVSFAKAMEEFKPIGTLSKLGDDAVYLLGAGEKLENEGIIELLPAETKEGNKGAFKYGQELKVAGSNYFNADFKKISLEEISRLKNEYDYFKKLDDKATMDDRENIAVVIIRTELENSTNFNLIPLLFGSAHDFKDNIEVSNALGVEKFGLIRLSPRKDKTPYETREGNN